ncbi:leucine-rich_repeat domain-containing protein [Hexamita inflata]|uniref:Leucine-rich repeat domain-containing protein n=1 Tax=Hexamita inflata TaxID=28002 RepID=A0AA86RLX0_9EUKA|nr:leucine-rich repeat domain-containing protein [Hexamita inflata]
MSDDNSIDLNEQFYRKCIENGTLEMDGIGEDDELQNIEFLEHFDIHHLEMNACANIIPKFKNIKLKELIILDSAIETLEQLQLENLEHFQLILEEYELQYSVKVNLQSPKLKYLIIQGYNIVDIDPLKQLTQLTTVLLSCCMLHNIDVLAYLTNLKELHMDYNSILYIYPLQELKQLEILTVTCNKITDFSPIQNHLNFKNYEIADQNKPSKEELILTEKVKNIYQNASLFRQIINKRNNSIGKLQLQTNKVIQQKLKQLQCNMGSFLNQVVTHFQVLQNYEYGNQ